MRQIEASGEKFSAAELNRLKGRTIEEATSDTNEAKIWYSKAIKLAREQSSRAMELRSATDLARLWHNQGKADEARQMLSPIYDWFTEGFDAPDMKAAKALLDELGKN